MRYTLPRGILNGALVLLSRRVSVSAGSNQDAQSYFRKLNSEWIFFMKSVKTDLDVVGMMKISAWLQEMLGIQPQIRRPWLELNFRNWNKPGALSRGRPLRNGYKEVEIVHLRSGMGLLIKRYTECLARPSVLELQMEGYVLAMEEHMQTNKLCTWIKGISLSSMKQN